MSDSSKVSNDKESIKLETKNSQTTFMRILSAIMIPIGVMLYSTYGILIRLSMLNNDHVTYSSNYVMVLIEAGKFITSLICLITVEGISQAITSIKSVPVRDWFLFCIPAIIYSITNNLSFYILQYMDPGSSSVLSQTKIICTTCMWCYWFAKPINKQQMISLFLLFCGSMLVAWPNGNANTQMYVIWPMGPLILALQIFLSSLACIYTEWVYKKDAKRSLHLDNLSMYFWGIVSNMLQFYYSNQKHPIAGFNMYTYLIIIANIGLGLCIGFILKYFNNIIKLLMSGISIVFSGILTYFIFGLNWTMSYAIGLFVVVCSLLIFKLQITIPVRHFVFVFTTLAIVCTYNVVDFDVKHKSLTMNVNNVLGSVFSNCTFNDTNDYFECDKGINYYYHLNAFNNTNENITDMNCKWIGDTEVKSLWKCKSSAADSNTQIPANISECAVIFNSGALLLKQYGKAIDSHSIVYRINFPQTKGYEQYVGNKTTFYVSDLLDPDQRYVGNIITNDMTLITFPIPMDVKEYETYNENKHNFEQLNIKWDMMEKERIYKCNDYIGYNCSIDLLTLMHSLEHCNDVDLYGLSEDICLPKHYYDKHKRKCDNTSYSSGTQNIALEHRAIRNLTQRFNLNIIL